MRNIKSHNKGFTLLEVLVVVAIVGILAAAVLALLSSARTKGGDAGVKSNLKSAIAQGEIFFNTNTVVRNTYTNVCTNGLVGGAQGVGLMVFTAAKDVGLSSYTINGTGGTLTTATCNDSATAWAAEVPLKSVSGMWCVDSTGKSKQEATSIGTNTFCN